MTIEKLRGLLAEQPLPHHGSDRYPRQQEALEQRRDAIRDGDLLALYTAIERCFEPRRRGFSFEDASLNPDLEPKFWVCEVPAWLLGEVTILLYKGLGGDWPKGHGRQATAARRHVDAWRDTVRAWKVLRAREAGIPWEQVFDHVSETLIGAGGPKAIQDAYRRVVRNLRRDPDYYRRIGPLSPHLADAAAGVPKLGK